MLCVFVALALSKVQASTSDIFLVCYSCSLTLDQRGKTTQPDAVTLGACGLEHGSMLFLQVDAAVGVKLELRELDLNNNNEHPRATPLL